MTHPELVARAASWLRSQGCTSIVAEKSASTAEEPDAIGWKGSGVSWLVECKASRADYIRDAKKAWRTNPSLGMGYYRLYMAPVGLISIDDLPPLWGLLEVAGRTARVIVEPQPHIERNTNAELIAALAALRRSESRVIPLRRIPMAV